MDEENRFKSETKAEIRRDEKGYFLPGNPPGPGRPKGQSLKEFAREYLMTLPPEAKKEYLDKLPQDIVWKMAEGMPSQEQEVKGNLSITVVKFNGTDDPS